MKKYEIWFGKDPEFIEGGECWPDDFSMDPEFKEKYVVGTLATDSYDFFREAFLNINENPIAMWYWIIVEGQLYISGAIDPMDTNILETIPKYNETTVN